MQAETATRRCHRSTIPGLLALLAGSVVAFAQEAPPEDPDAGIAETPPAAEAARAAAATQAADVTEAKEPEIDLDLDLADLDLEALLDIDLEVTSIAGVGQSLQSTPGAIYVLTPEDIRRTGSWNIAEALRVVPGFTVQRITSNIWGISARGQTSRFANKLLVQVDGRSVYNPLFSGTFWDSTTVVLEDLERVEIIRGPGATIFGANAVNGVVNIETKHARDTQGLLIQGRAGSDLLGGGTARFGGKLGDNTYYRVYGEFNEFDDFQSDLFSTAQGLLGPADGLDDWNQVHAGFRVDTDIEDDATLTFIGDFYNSDRIGNTTQLIPEFTPPLPPSVPVVPAAPFAFDAFQRTFAFTGRFVKTFDDGSGIKLQAFFDSTERSLATLDYLIETVDISFQHNFSWGNINELVYGFGYRNTELSSDPFRDLAPQLIPQDSTADLFSGFIQNTTTLIDDKLFVTYGAKFEDNDFSGFEVQPSFRISYSPIENLTFWGAVSRAVRTPNFGEENAFVPFAALGATGDPVPSATFVGVDGVDAEVLEAYEGGVRWRINENAKIDLAMFYNEYEELITVFAPPSGAFGANGGEGDTLGVEVFGEFNVIPGRWTVIPAYTYLRSDFSTGFTPGEASDPEHQFNIQSRLDVTEDIELNSVAYYVDGIGTTIDVDDYVRLDVGLTFRFSPNVELAVWGQNLLDDEHIEGVDTVFSAQVSRVERSVFAQLTLRF